MSARGTPSPDPRLLVAGLAVTPGPVRSRPADRSTLPFILIALLGLAFIAAALLLETLS